MELIKIIEKQGQKVVSARDLHSFLGAKKQFADWIKGRIKKYGLIEGQDFIIVSPNGEAKRGGQNAIEYGLTFDAAKELAMVEGNAKGKEARQYFIEMEKRAKTPQTQAEMLLMAVQNLVQQEKAVKELDNRLTRLEAKSATRPEYMTVMGYAIIKKVQVGLTLAATIGRKACKICKDNGYEIEKIKDPRFGLVGSYPEIVLEQVFNETIN